MNCLGYRSSRSCAQLIRRLARRMPVHLIAVNPPVPRRDILKSVLVLVLERWRSGANLHCKDEGA